MYESSLLVTNVCSAALTLKHEWTNEQNNGHLILSLKEYDRLAGRKGYSCT